MSRKVSAMAAKATPILWAGHPLYISKDGRMDSLDEGEIKRYDAAQERLQRETNESQAAMAALIKQESEAMTNATN